MSYQGACHCGKVSYEVAGDLQRVMQCNCSICSKKGYLLWFVPRSNLRIQQGEKELSTYTFNTHHIKHQFCPTCGCAPYGLGSTPDGTEMAAINVRCLNGVELDKLEVDFVDGRAA